MTVTRNVCDRIHVLSAPQVLALAPDPASAKAGQQLAAAANWMTTGIAAPGLWGECKGSGATPYQVRIDIDTMGYTCSCPSRKFPCKHVLALLLLHAAGSVPAADPPQWLEDWLRTREEKARAKAGASGKAAKPVDKATAAATAAKRSAERERRIDDGLEDMERWLRDIARLGLARIQAVSPAFWDEKAARLVDAQAPGLARRVRALGGIAASGQGWEARMLDALGSLYLLRVAYAKADGLRAELRADVRRYVGWTQREDDVRSAPDTLRIDDDWLVIGVRTEEDDRFVAHRAWLRGGRSGAFALVLQFSQSGIAPAQLFGPGSSFAGSLAFFPASVPQRAIAGERREHAGAVPVPNGINVEALLERYAASVARDPWFESMPVVIDVARTEFANGRLCAADEHDRALPISKGFARPHALHALCGGRPLTLAAEWNGRFLYPLAVWTGGRYVPLA